MSDFNEGSNFGDRNFSEFISKERDRLRSEREQIFGQQEELHAELDAVNRELPRSRRMKRRKPARGAAGTGRSATANATRQQAGGFT